MERREPTLSGIVPERDEQESGSPAPRKQRDSYNEPPASSGKSGAASGIAVFALLLAFAGIGGSGYLAWQLNESQKTLVSAEQRIAGLETRLNIDSDESSQTLDQIQDKLKWADSEIRKLWGVSQDTNRKKITANEDSIASLTRKIGAVEKDAAAARTSAAAIKRDLDERVVALKSQLDTASAAMKTLENSARDIQTLRDNLDRVTQQMPGLRDLATRVKTNEEAITAIDTYRRSLNRDLLQLKQQIGGTPAP